MLYIIADGTYQTVSHSRHLSGLVRNAMIPAEHVLTLHEAMSLQDFQQMFLRYGFRGYPVFSRSTVIGLVVYDRVKDHPRWIDPDNTSVRVIMIPLSPDMTIAGTSPVQQVLDCMLVRGRDRLLVFDHSRFAGLLSRSVITRIRAAVPQPDRPWWRLGKPLGTRPARGD
jgi:predicted transcriptional regulator